MRPLHVTLPDAVLSVRHFGEGAPGRGFLLVHGLASNARLWDETAAALVAAGHPTWAVDLRGHGDSTLPDNGFDTATAATDLAAVCAALDLRSVIAVGQSWGGNVVVRFAAEYPDLVSAVALVDGGWIDLAGEFADWADCEQALRPPSVDGMRAGDLEAYLRKAHPDWSDAAVSATAYNLRELPDGTVERRLPIPRHMEIVRDMWDHPVWDWLPRITAPTLLLPALPNDPVRAERTRARVDRAAAALPDARVQAYAGGDHDLHAQRPKELAADLLSLAG
ncbi:alpha/beta fold hydrolase [Hamadaea sp. NPDC051192]|uniref:alpha/beta fold hydrolase n=1 Tax=Hamadaea sp. NPDC051192 TaxID=3154940 RepID=UPI0034292241